ncbi:MAG: tRNA 2-thiocytidine biosynthesis TtcA family protein [Candidatus Krumholzibacteriia bacterium]
MTYPELDKKVHWLGKRVARAQREFGLFAAHDRVLVAFSGGKDSLALLHVLPAWARAVGLPLTIEAVHVEVLGAPPRRDVLAPLAEAAGVPLSFTAFAPDAAGPGPDGRVTHPCFRCGRLRREALLQFARAGGWQAVALGHHLDDDAETVLMNQLYHGVTKGLRPRRDYPGAGLRLVRPLIMAEERELADLGRHLTDVPFTCACPGGHGLPPDSARQQMKAFLRSLGPGSRAAKRHLQRLGQAAR